MQAVEYEHARLGKGTTLLPCTVAELPDHAPLNRYMPGHPPHWESAIRQRRCL